MRTVDDIASDFVNAKTDEERAALVREMDAVNGEILAAHNAAGHKHEYSDLLRRRPESNNFHFARIRARMRAGNL